MELGGWDRYYDPFSYYTSEEEGDRNAKKVMTLERKEFLQHEDDHMHACRGTILHLDTCSRTLFKFQMQTFKNQCVHYVTVINMNVVFWYKVLAQEETRLEACPLNSPPSARFSRRGIIFTPPARFLRRGVIFYATA